MYEILVTRNAQKSLGRIEGRHRERVSLAILALRQDPFQGKHLKGGDRRDLRSLRVWPYRIVYQMFRQELIVSVIDAPHRKDAYR